MFRAAPSSTHDDRCSIQEGGINRKTVDSTKQCTCAFAALTSLRLRRGVSTCTSNLRRCACDRLASFRACARVCAGFAHIVISVRAPRISSSLRGLRAYARVRASSARMLVSAGPPRVCSCLRGLRAYARLCAAMRVCSSLCAAQGELSSRALGPGCPSGTTRQWAAHVLVRQALSKMNRALLVTPLAGGGLPAAGLNRSCATRTPTMHSYLYGLCVRMFACNCMPLSLSLSPSLAFYFDHLYHHIPRLWFCFCVILLGMMLSARPLLSMCYRLPLPNVAYKCILKCIRCLQ